MCLALHASYVWRMAQLSCSIHLSSFIKDGMDVLAMKANISSARIISLHEREDTKLVEVLQISAIRTTYSNPSHKNSPRLDVGMNFPIGQTYVATPLWLSALIYVVLSIGLRRN